MIHVELPYDFGTFVKIKDVDSSATLYATISSYFVYRDGVTVWVSGYKEAWCGEYLMEEIELMTEEEIKQLKEKYNEK